MSPADFLNTSVSFSNPPQRQGSPLAGMLSALAASLEAASGNVVFQLDPWDDLAAARTWMNLAGPQTLLLPSSRSDQASPARILAVTGLPGRAVADGSIVPTRAVADFVRVADLKHVVLVDVSGPVDVSDVLFFRTLIQRNLGLLSAEPRVQRVLQQCDSSITLQVRERQDALECMSDALTRYAQRFLGTDAEMAGPPLDMVDRLLSASGRLRIRPIETERGMAHLDIGVQVEPELQSPAGVSVLYDTATGQWHDQ